MTAFMKFGAYALLGLALLAGFLVAPAAAAELTAGPLLVDFEDGMGLFSQVRLEYDTPVTRTVAVTNAGAETESVYTEVENATSTGLAEVVSLTIESNGTVYYEGTFADFFERTGVELGTLEAEETRAYSYTVALLAEDVLRKQMDFDLVVGFVDGPAVTTRGEKRNVPEEEPVHSWIDRSFFGGMGGLFKESEEVAEEVWSTTMTTAGEVNRVSSPTAIFITEAYCDFWWLLLLMLIPVAWSGYDALYRHRREDRFRDIARFAAVYVSLLLLFQILGVLHLLWVVFAAAWTTKAVMDYRYAESLDTVEEMQDRNIFFAGASSLLIITAFFFTFPCEWWPFMLVSVASGLLYLFAELDKEE